MTETIHIQNGKVHSCQCGLPTVKRYKVTKTGKTLWLCFLCIKNYQINELKEID